MGRFCAKIQNATYNLLAHFVLYKRTFRFGDYTTFFFRVSGVSMVDADMDEGDIIIVDRAVQPYNDCKAVCYIDGEYTVKRMEIGEGRIRLMPANENNAVYQPIEVTPENNFMVWGVVTYVIKKM